MKHLIYSSCLISLSLGTSVYAQQFSTFHEKPALKIALAEELAEKAETEHEAAVVWAKANNKLMRYDDGFNVTELMAIENGKPVYYITHNERAAISTAANLVRDTAPYNLNGLNINVGVWDAGAVRTSHQEFDNNRAVVKDGTSTTHYHATHVAGTVGAKGVRLDAKGMAPKASIHSYYWNNDISEMTTAAATAPGQSGNKVYLSNHSYGRAVGWHDGSFINNRDEFGQYHSESRIMDQLAFNAQYYLAFWSAGNDRNDGSGSSSPVGDGQYKSGYDCISHEAIGKNVMTVGAVNDAVSGSSRSLSGATMTTFSSWGPADDGRIKPDIVANGSGLTSTDDDNDTDYRTISGTSMSSPNACGSAALLVEYYKELFPPNGAMRASTLKGLILHTASDLGRPGPDYVYGWGLMNTKVAADLLQEYAGGASNRLTEESITTAAPSDSYLFQWNGTDPIRVTLCWTDPAGPAISSDENRTPDLVNDLDLKITKAGTTYYPYKLSYASPSSNATTGDNDVDNVEQVYIASPSAGLYTVTVNYEGSLTGSSQWYSLIITGDSGDADLDDIPDSWEALYFGGATNAVASEDIDGDGADNLTEYVSGTIPNDPNSVFKVTAYDAPVDENDPFIINWNPVMGRIYTVEWTENISFIPFSSISPELPYPANSYTDSVNRAGSQQFYRVDVKLP